MINLVVLGYSEKLQIYLYESYTYLSSAALLDIVLAKPLTPIC